jgi:predicted nucleic acid-binding protein
VALAWFFEDEQSTYADHVLSLVEADGALAPFIWPAEIANSLIVAERRGRLTHPAVQQATVIMSHLPITVDIPRVDEILGPILELARAHGLSAYDAAYLHLAARESLPLATEDDRLRAAALTAGVRLVQHGDAK